MIKTSVQMNLFELVQAKVIAEPQPGSPGFRYDNDGVTADRFERIAIPVPKKMSLELVITLARGDSEAWYFGRDIKYGTEGSLYGPFPKFSDKYNSRKSALNAAVINIIAFFHKKGLKASEMKPILAVLDSFTVNLAALEG